MENNEWIWYFREERERNGISRKAVAAVAGISREYLCRLETGKLPVTDKTRKRLAAALKTLYPDPLNLMIDYVRIRFPTMDARHIIEDVLRLKMKYMAQEDHGLYLLFQYVCAGDVVVMTSPKEENGVLLELKGKGCRQFEAYLDGQQRSWYEFFRQCLDEDAVFKRIDLAVNDRAGFWIFPICVISATAGMYLGIPQFQGIPDRRACTSAGGKQREHGRDVVYRLNAIRFVFLHLRKGL